MAAKSGAGTCSELAGAVAEARHARIIMWEVIFMRFISGYIFKRLPVEGDDVKPVSFREIPKACEHGCSWLDLNCVKP
jgi:hypothetical protein